MAFAVPQFQRIAQVLRISGDMRDITGTIAQAKMHAAADFTHARARANLAANTFQLEIWNKAGAGCWQTVGDPANPCTIGTSPIQPLSTGVTFGFGAMAAPPPNTQLALAQAPKCLIGYGGGPPSGPVKRTARIQFNSPALSAQPPGPPNPHTPPSA